MKKNSTFTTEEIAQLRAESVAKLAATLSASSPSIDAHPVNISAVDLTRPPGFVGTVADWIDGQCRFPRRNLAVAAALVSVGNIAGLRTTDDIDGISLNLIGFCRAGSATGKEAIQQAALELHRAAGIQGAVHGGIKSEQEIIRNLTRHQAAFYIVDEIGIMLKKISNAQQRGGAAYLEGVIGRIMEAYSKATGYMVLSGDAREDLRKGLTQELLQCRKIVSENEDKGGRFARRAAQVEHALENLDNGLDRPFFSLLGFTTPVTFDDCVTYENATNGFIGRALLVNEPETNPQPRAGFVREPMQARLSAALANLYSPGSHDPQAARVEWYDERKPIKTTPDAADALATVAAWFFSVAAEDAKQRSGLEAIPRRAYEMVAKVSTILAAHTGTRTLEHVAWAYALARRDADYKIAVANANVLAVRADTTKSSDARTDALCQRILTILSGSAGETQGVIINRLRKSYSRDEVCIALGRVVSTGMIEQVEITHAGNGTKAPGYRLTAQQF